jgi:hypothetical protein
MLDGLLLGSCQSSRQSSRHSSCHSSRSSNAGSPQADAQSSEAPSAACDPKLQPAAASSKFDFSLDLQLGNRTPSPADVEALMAACAPRFRPPFIDWAADNRSLSTQGDIFRRGCELYLQGAAGEADDWAGSSMAHTSQVSAASGAAAMPEARAQADRDMAAMADAQAVRDAEWLSCTQLASTRPSGRSSSRRHKGRKGSRK